MIASGDASAAWPVAGGAEGLPSRRAITAIKGGFQMRKLMISAVVIAAAGSIAGVAYSQAPKAPANNVTVLHTTPLEKDPSRIVRLQSVVIPAHGGNNFHRHNGDQWSSVQEGEITFTIKGQAPRVLKAGEGVYIPRGTVHRNQNLTDKSARSIELNIMDKDAPVTVPVTD
jgi:quercetin dioxygenase-like cupin family protein